jgi:DNA ligase-1
VYGSPKLDGIRCVIKDDMALSRTLKPIPNEYIQDTLGIANLNGLDGEITVGPANAANVMQATSSGCMSEQGQPDFTYWVFDFWTTPHIPFGQRYNTMRRCFADRDGPMGGYPRVQLLPQVLLHNDAELRAYEASMVEQGFEGIMVRDPTGLYKYGRSTAREGYLLKIKRWTDAEAIIIGFQEAMYNGNEATVDELGHTKRSTHAENMVGKDTLGAFLVRNAEGVEFKVAPGVLTADQRLQVWREREQRLGQHLTYKTFTVSGVKDKPRFNVFKAFRNAIDIGEPK